MSDLSGDLIARLRILTSGSRVSTEKQRNKEHSGRNETVQISIVLNVEDTPINC